MRARELPASGHALGVASRLKAAFAIRDGATAVEEAVKTFPMLQIRIFDAQTKAREEVPDSLNLVPGFRWCACGNGRTGLGEPSRRASRPYGFDPSRDHESLAGGTRLRVPPSFHSGVAITAPLRVPS
ncbi:hypothetical protein ACH79_25810 [Bradyrhizobium sp. CCBAU 051011]|nr:hypothetical protein ACH79_25810 [Bradyrhizobium sp. CCBAU 051011]